MSKQSVFLGIETSCDETAAAIVTSSKDILSNKVLSQIQAHELYGGVVPEIAAREHLDHIDSIILAALDEADVTLSDLDGVAATSGPGLIGGVMIGMMTGKALAASHKLPFFAINHLEGHALSARLCEDISFPFLLLLVSGGHTALLDVSGVGRYHTLGQTLDDALGELFDKSGKMMGLPFPGGPEVEKMAQIVKNNDQALSSCPLPRPMKGRKNMDFSFSGLKTAVKNHIDALPPGDLKREDIQNLCYSLQESVADILIDRCQRALCFMKDKYNKDVPLVIAGGVAANQRLRQALSNLANDHHTSMIAPPGYLCSDNAAMIAWAGLEHMMHDGPRHDFSFMARPRWPLDQLFSKDC